MSRGVYFIFPALILAACCFFAGCSSTPSDTGTVAQEKVNQGVSFGNQTEGPLNYSYEEVMDSIQRSRIDPVPDALPNLTDMHILSLTGEALDERANASSWTFVVLYQGSTKFITYDQQGESITSWTREFKGQEVFPEQVLSPAALFTKNHAAIFPSPQSVTNESRRMALQGSNYTLTITGGNSPRILVFDAKTGALTSSNER